jgi:hypothetical protein
LIKRETSDNAAPHSSGKLNLHQSQTLALNELLESYARAARRHVDATTGGDYRAANSNQEILAQIYREIRRRGAEAQREFLKLIAHPDEAVRGWSAGHSLEFSPDQAHRVLEEIAAGPGIWSFVAQVTLEEWEQGTLKFP